MEPTHSKATHLLLDRWLAFNIRGQGLYKSGRGGKYSYTGPIFYSGGWPVARLVKMPNGHWACLNKHYIMPSSPRTWLVGGGPVLKANLHVPDVGAFSPYDGDWLDSTALHERLRTLWMRIAASQVELAQEMPFPTLVEGTGSWAGQQVALRNALVEVDKNYGEYNAAFQLRWGAFPTVYRDELRRVIENRVRAYHSPEETAKRERAEARAGAKTAFGLDNKKRKKK